MKYPFQTVFRLLLLVVFISHAADYAFGTATAKIKTYSSDGFSFWEMEDVIPVIANYNTPNSYPYININTYGKKDYIPVIRIRFLDISTDSGNLIKSLGKKAAASPKNEKQSTLRIFLSNGEVLTSNKSYYKDAAKEGFEEFGIVDIFTGADNLRSSSASSNDYSDNIKASNYVFGRLESYDISKIEIDGVILRTKDFKTSEVFKNMMPGLKALYNNPSPSTTSPAAPKNPSSTSQSNTVIPANKPYAVVENVWTDFNVVENWQKGMRIHVKFNIHNHQGKNACLCVFFNFENGAKVPGKLTGYCSPEGQATSQSPFVPKYKDTTFNDFSIFVPYNTFNLSKGNYKLVYTVDIFDTSTPYTTVIGQSNRQYINYSK